MSHWADFQIMCRNCLGKGTVVPPHDTSGSPPAEVPCPSCDGVGYVDGGRVKIKAILDAIAELT